MHRSAGSIRSTLRGSDPRAHQRSKEMENPMADKAIRPKKICLAYSGGLDTSVIIPWLKENYAGAEVVAYCGNVGQGEGELEGLETKARQSGATKLIIEDLRGQLLEEVIFPALRAGAVYERRYLLGTSFARPILARGQVRAALHEGCDALAHGCTGKGNDQVRFELCFQALAPELAVIAPWREWDLKSREDLLKYAAAHGVPVKQSANKIYSRDRNLWHLSHEGGELEDPAQPVPEHVWQLTVNPAMAPAKPDRVKIGFEGGSPVAVDGNRLRPAELLELLNLRAAAHGVGRVDLVENRRVGIKSRGAYEAPGGTVLVAALQALEEICLDRESMRLKDSLSDRYADLIYDGLWFSPVREAIDSCIGRLLSHLSGEVEMELLRGSCRALSKSSPHSLYRESLATFGEGQGFDQKDSRGFIKLHGLQAALAWRRDHPSRAQTTARK